MKMTRTPVAILFALLIVADVAHAQTTKSMASQKSAPPAPASASIASSPMSAEEATGQKETAFQQLDHLNTENVLLGAQIEHQKLVNKLAQLRAGKDPDDQRSNQPAMGSMPSSTLTPALPLSTTMPEVPSQTKGASVELVSTSPKLNGGAPTATITLPSGRSVNAMVGSKISGIGTISFVSAHQVLYRDSAGHELALPFGSGNESGGH